MRSEVRLAAWMPATRATASTSPLVMAPRATSEVVSGCMCTRPRATARRWRRLLGRDVDHAGPAQRIEVGEAAVGHGRSLVTGVSALGAAAQPPIWLIERRGRMKCTWLMPWPAHLAPTRAPRWRRRGRRRSAPPRSDAAQVGLLEGEQAVAELAVGGEPDPVARARRTASVTLGMTPTSPAAVEVAEPLGRLAAPRASARAGRRRRWRRRSRRWATTWSALQRRRRRRAA